MRRILFAAVVSAIVIAPAALSDQRPRSGKRPWQLTTKERLALRTSPAMLERLRITPFTASPPDGSRHPAETFRFRIEGRTHPELLLPFELFRNLLAGLRSNAEGAAILREAYAPIIARLNLPPDLLQQLVDLADPYLSREARIQRINERLSAASPLEAVALRDEADSFHALQCSSLFDALAAARQHFGATAFDQFLYEAVAPGFVVTMTERDDVRELTRWEGGCR